MPGLLKKIGNLLIYKEPGNEEKGFELLEDENEGVEQDNAPNAPNTGNNPTLPDVSTQNGAAQEGRKRSGKTPVKVENWNEIRKSEKDKSTCRPPDNPENVSSELCANLATIKQKFGIPKNQDFVIREFKIGRKIKAFMVYIEQMIDKNTLNQSIFPQLMSREISGEIGEGCPVDYLVESVLTIYKVDRTREYTEIVMEILSGASALFIEGCSECVLLDTRGFEKRNIEKPVTETVVRGSQEGFTESLRTNLTLLRRIIKNEKMVTELLTVGKMNNSSCAIIYLEGIANPKVVDEVKKRIKKIDTDLIMGAGMIEQFIEDNPFMLFPQVLSTERPDRAASFVMEGQIIVVAEGTPFAIAMPITFFRLLHTSEDSFARWPYGTFLRLIRIIGMFFAALLPGLYVAIVLFHPEVIPTELLSSIASAKESVPFPTIIEVLILDISFELIREGGVRVPTIIGQTLGIVGALILGEAAVAARLVSPILVIVIAVTALGNFTIPNYSMALAVRIARFFFIFAGAVLGMYGISLMIFLLTVTACSMKSFGVPFLSPVAPRTRKNPDVIIRYPVWMQKDRPDEFNTLNRKRQGNNVEMWRRNKNQANGNNKRRQDNS